MRVVAWVWAGVLFASAFAGCGETTGSTSAKAGSENGPCYGNGTCDGDLVCASHVCVRLPGGTDGSIETGGGSNESGGAAGKGGTVSRGGTPSDSGGGGMIFGGAGGLAPNQDGGGAAGAGGSNGGFGGLLPTNGGAGGGSCVSASYTAERPPLDLYFLVDKSGSMDQNNKWTYASGALVAFLNDVRNASVGAGIGYFPLTLSGAPTYCCLDTDCGSFGPCVSTLPPSLGCDHPFGYCQAADVCQVSTYAQPAVPLVLPPNHVPVVSSIQGTSPGGGTPTRPALEGAMQYVITWSQANPGRTIALVLVTDGDPSGCSTNAVQDVANIAANGLVQFGVRTFVVGLGSSLTSLNLVAQAGGTGQAYLLDVVGDAGTQVTNALAKIHTDAFGCDYLLPTEAQSDPTLINVVSVAGTGAPLVIPRTNDGTKASCGSGLRWYYDNAGAPKAARLCPDACTNLAPANATVKIEYGCLTLVAPP